MAIAALGGSASVTAAVADAQMRLDELLRAIPVIPANIAHSDQQHAAIVEAILGGQADQGPHRDGGARRRHWSAAARLLELTALLFSSAETKVCSADLLTRRLSAWRPERLSLENLRTRIADGSIDTVVLRYR